MYKFLFLKASRHQFKAFYEGIKWILKDSNIKPLSFWELGLKCRVNGCLLVNDDEAETQQQII